MFYLPELKIPIASRLAHKQNTLFAKPVRSILKKAISGSDVVHIYQPWPLGSAAQRVARQMNIPAIAAFHIQPENITFNIGLKRFSPAAHLTYFLFYLFFYRRFSHIHCPSKLLRAAQEPRIQSTVARHLKRRPSGILCSRKAQGTYFQTN